jgi:biopolymer transport protein TolR
MPWLPSSSTTARPRPRPVMNVTPLVDVVLVLLIIFMVVIPAMSEVVEVKLPGVANVDEKQDEKAKPFILSVSEQGDLYLDEDKVPAPRIELALRAASRREPARKLVLRADVGVPYGKIRPLYRVVQEVGFPGVSLRVNHRKPEGGATAAR